ncbi:hypothetical protein D6779_01470 [Candidatus Parcubacteria bacterium]|nr:MAG: hypothetical protein D6779_01470 [Candidatus Parcubacteria bacterium]
MEIREITFRFKGEREYIQGPDIYNAMVKGPRNADLTDIRFSVHEFVKVSTCKIFSSTSKEEIDKLGHFEARCQYCHNGLPVWLGLRTDPDTASGEKVREPYQEERVTSLCRIEVDEITLDGMSPFSFIETIVAMNKHHLQTLFPGAPGKWVFTRIDLIHGCNKKEGLKLVFRHNVGFRLTKSDVVVDGVKIGDIYFSLVRS